MTSGWFVVLSIIGIGIGAVLVYLGLGGSGLGAAMTLFVGLFMVVKEILDIFH